MGTCARKKLKISSPPQPLALSYPQSSRLKVKNRASFRGNSFIELEFKLPKPLKVLIEDSFPLFPSSKLSLCVLPGLNPRKMMQKSCQDNCFFIQNPESVLLGLFDGHGKNGEKVVELLLNISIKYFQHFSNEVRFIQQNPEYFLADLAEKSAQELELADFDCSQSGSTQLIVLVTPSSIFSCNIGDSRAVLGSGSNPSLQISTRSHFLSSSEFNKVRFMRSQHYARYLVPCQLTKDHKPSDSEENLRVHHTGAKIDRIPYSQNLTMSPFRIIDPSGQLPSISVSRVQGDFSFRRVGVISEASIKIFPTKRDDFFLVLASDGVWDVMENEEVVSFIETFRSLCRDQLDDNENVNLSNSCIAQLLCEEARTRWLSLMSKNDVNMDDISCIVFEIKDTPDYIKASQSNDFEHRLSTSSGLFTSRDLKQDSWVLPSTESFVVNNI